MKKKKISQNDLVVAYFKENPNRDIKHPEVVDAVVALYKKKTGDVFRDPDRAIRKLFQQGFLIKVTKGVYRYEPNAATNRKVEDFTAAQKKEILKRDSYKCVMCGRGKEEGYELNVDHIKAKDLGGKAIIGNGQTLCSQHNFLKKNFNQTETGKKMFIKIHELAQKDKEKLMFEFTKEILEVFEKHGINGHI